MGKRGPAGKPTELRLLHNDRPDRVNHDEPKPPPGALVPPDDMSDDVRAVWDYTLKNLIHMGIATLADRDALVCYCEAVVTHRRCSKLLAEQDMLIEGHRHVMVRNPAVAMQRDAASSIRAFANEFGFTPSARSDISKGAAADRGTSAERYLTG